MIGEGSRVSWRFSPQPRRFGTVYKLIQSEDAETGEPRVIGYRVLSDDAGFIVLAAGDVTKEN